MSYEKMSDEERGRICYDHVENNVDDYSIGRKFLILPQSVSMDKFIKGWNSRISRNSYCRKINVVINHGEETKVFEFYIQD